MHTIRNGFVCTCVCCECNYFYHSQQEDRKFNKYKIRVFFQTSKDFGHSSNCHTRETNFMRKPEIEIHLFCRRVSWMTTVVVAVAVAEQM